ncbi:unnamed protein product, partial [Prorocentrum cordatum]
GGGISAPPPHLKAAGAHLGRARGREDDILVDIREGRVKADVPHALRHGHENVLRSSVPEGARDRPVALPGPPTGTLSADASQAAEAPAGDAPTSSDLWGLEGPGDSIYELDGSVRADPQRRPRCTAGDAAAAAYWQSYDGFARVAMSMGTNQLVTALAYYVIGYVLISNHAVIASWLGS